MEALELQEKKGTGNDEIKNRTNSNLEKECERNEEKTGLTEGVKRNGISEGDSEEKEVDESQEKTKRNKTNISQDVNQNVKEPGGIKNKEYETIYKKGKQKSQNDNVKEQSMFKAGDTVLQSKPFAFIIQASHRFGGRYFIFLFKCSIVMIYFNHRERSKEFCFQRF